MNAKAVLSVLAAGLIFSGCAGKIYTCKEGGVIVKVQNVGEDGPALVRLEVLGDKLIHVSATPEKKFADPESLVILEQERNTPFTVTSEDEVVTVATSAVKANVLVTTGEVWFTDPDGNVILKEKLSFYTFLIIIYFSINSTFSKI